MRVTWPVAYIAFGMILWVAALKAGLEAALIDVLVALAIPMRISCSRSISPMRLTEQRLHPWNALYIVPIFTFFNAGIGFTMRLFVTTLALADPAIKDTAKLAIFIGSAISMLTGIAWLACVTRSAQQQRRDVQEQQSR